jgi:hypothetical protein
MEMTNLEQAAYNYGKACADFDSAKSCHVPYMQENQLKLLLLVAMDNLYAAATQYYDNVYDGGEP